jgi:hypothetical protein
MAPDESLTMPATAGWANAGVERRNKTAKTKVPLTTARIDRLRSFVTVGRTCVAYGKPMRPIKLGTHIVRGMTRSVEECNRRMLRARDAMDRAFADYFAGAT